MSVELFSDLHNLHRSQKGATGPGAAMASGCGAAPGPRSRLVLDSAAGGGGVEVDAVADSYCHKVDGGRQNA